MRVEKAIKGKVSNTRPSEIHDLLVGSLAISGRAFAINF